MTFAMSNRGGLLCGAALAALVGGAAHPAFAAEATPPASTQVGEIVVTATRREEALSDVPVAVTAITGEQVQDARVQNFQDLPAMVPGATFVSTKGQSTANVQIRGQVQTNDSPHLDMPVAIFMDDVYFGTTASFSADFFDIDQIAILRGPQGTTFGRNVVGGAVQIVSQRPRFGDDGGEIMVGLSKYSTARDGGFESQGFVNHDLSDTLAGRLAFSVKSIGGYSPNRTTGSYLNDQRSFALRPSLLWRPTDRLDVLFTGYYFHENQFPSGYKSTGQGSVQAANDAAANSEWDVFHDVDGEYRRTIYTAQIRADYDMDFADLTSITSYRSLASHYVDDGDSSPQPVNPRSLNRSDEFQFSQEFRLTSPGDQRFEWVAGAYYSFENLRKEIHFTFNGTIPGNLLGAFTGGTAQVQDVVGDNHVTSLAAFGEGTYHFSDQWSATLGGRYTYEGKEGYTNHIGSSVFYGPAFAVQFEDSWTSFTPRLIIDFKPNDDLMFYASASTGFKGGGWSLTATSAARAIIPLEPEDSISYEAGAKVQLFDRRLLANLAVYQADTENLQVRSLVAGVLRDSNAGQLRVKGVEFEATLRPVEGLTLGLNYAYTDAIYRDFRGCAAGGVDCTGNTAPFVPENDLKLTGEYRWTLANDGALTARADVQWADAFEQVPTNGQPLAKPLSKKDGVVNASLVYESADDLWRAQLFVKNLTNEWYYGAAANYYFYFLTTAEFGAGAREVDRGPINPPRQVGVSLTRRF